MAVNQLTKDQKEVFIAAVIADTPRTTREEEKAMAQFLVTKAMTPRMRKLCADAPRAVRVENTCTGQHYNTLQVADVGADEVLRPLREAEKARVKAVEDLRTVVFSCRTREQLSAALPELGKYLPRLDGPTPNLPAVTGLVDRLVSAGLKL